MGASRSGGTMSAEAKSRIHKQAATLKGKVKIGRRTPQGKDKQRGE